MELPSTPGNGRGDFGGSDERMQKAESGAEYEEKPKPPNKQLSAEAEPEKEESIPTPGDEDGDTHTAFAPPTTPTSSLDETKHRVPPNNNIDDDHNAKMEEEEEIQNKSRSARTPDSMAFSMGIHSMDEPPTTPIVFSPPPVGDMELSTPKRTSISLEQLTTTPSAALGEEAETNPLPALQLNVDNNQNNNSIEIQDTSSRLFQSNSNEEKSSIVTTFTVNSNSFTNADLNTNSNTNITTPAAKKASATYKTLAAIFGGPSIGTAPGDYSTIGSSSSSGITTNLNNLAAAQHDYTLVGDSPYETTYDPQSAFYFDRVYGQLYITTVSVMFRGKAFGPIGAIPYERRLLLNFLEIATMDPFKTTSIKITMNDGESYVFKSFADREAMVKLLKKTKRKCSENHQQQQQQHHNRMHTTSIVSASLNGETIRSNKNINTLNNNTSNINTPIANNRSLENTLHFQTSDRVQRRSRTPSSMERKPKSQEDKYARRRSQSVPSSLRQTKTARASSKSLTTTPIRNSVSFYESKENSETSSSIQIKAKPKTPKTTQRSKPIPIGSLRLSLQDDGHTAETVKATQKNDEMNRPRRLFELEPNKMVTTSNATAAAMMLSPPRTRISQRKQPKTPQVAAVTKTPTATDIRDKDKNNNKTANKTSQQVHRREQTTTTPRERNHLGKLITGGTLASIPPIPTVPLLNTPELSSQKRIITIQDSRVARGTAVPLSIPEIANDDASILEITKANTANNNTNSNTVRVAPLVLAPFTPIDNHSPAPSAQDIMVEKAWKTAIFPTIAKDWTVALEPTKLPNCNLDEWFDLFFSDDAFFSLARYQLEHVGDRDVSFHPWRRKQKNNCDEKKTDSVNHNLNNNNETEIPELEREIRYIHPIGGSMIGPSEAETFRVQSLKRYRNHGAILKNTTTVGKGIPMGDCFRVEDMWVIEKDPSESLLTISVSFNVVFVKRTMFKGMIQKNTLSETRDWFKGYSTMLQTALESPQHQELVKKRQLYACSIVPEEIANATTSPSSSTAPSLSLSMRDSSVKNTSESLWGSSGDYGEFAPHSPHSSSSVTDTSDGQFSHKERGDAKKVDSNNKTKGLVVWIALAVVVVVLPLLVAFWLQVRSVRTSLSQMESSLGELKAQNTVLLQKLEEFSAVATSKSAGTEQITTPTG